MSRYTALWFVAVLQRGTAFVTSCLPPWKTKHFQKGVYYYPISSVIRRSFFFFQNNPKDLDPSCKTDLELLDCLGRVNLVL